MPKTTRKVKSREPTKEEQSAKSGEPKVTEICKEKIDKLTNRRTFEPWEKPSCGCRFFRFRKRGETIEGKLGKGIPNFRQGTSYPLELDNGETVEIVGNRILHDLIRRGELVGQRVRITYVGAEAYRAGHYRKVYRVFKIQL